MKANLTSVRGAVAAEINRRMIEAELTQKSLALKAGLNETYVRDILRGRSKNPKSTHLAKLAVALDCSVDDLLPRGAAPKLGESLKDLDELSLIGFWRELNRPQRELFMNLVQSAAATARKIA